MQKPSIAATINDVVIELGPDRTLRLHMMEGGAVRAPLTLTAQQAAALYAFFQRPDVAESLEDVRAPGAKATL